MPTGMVREPMPWDLTDLRERGTAYGSVVVIEADRADGRDVVATLAAVAVGECLVLEVPGPDDAHELRASRSTRPDLARARDLAVAAGLTVHDCAQWRTRYVFVDAEAVLAFLDEAWWLPTPDATLRARLAEHRGPVTATASRYHLVVSRQPSE